MTIYPTVLYIKQHSVTKLKYFGKTTRDPLKYNGSGIYWTRHIKKHGKEYVTNLWVSEPYTDSDAIVEFALAFSLENDIVASSAWANMVNENGLDGATPGRTGQIPWNKGILIGPNGRQGIPSPLKGKPNGKQGISTGPNGPQQNPAPKVECPHCGKIGNRGAMKRWHFDNCKKKPTLSIQHGSVFGPRTIGTHIEFNLILER